MKLTLQIKLLPDDIQAQSLLDTIKNANAVCNTISETAWKEKTFNQFRLHNLVYRSTKDGSGLTAQVVVRCISKVSDSYKLDKKVQRVFKPFGAITYDTRILSYKENTVSIWTVNGRLKIPLVCYRPDWLPFVKGEADLITRRGKFFLLQTVEIPEEGIKDVEEFLGCDFGLINIATLSDGEIMSSKELETYREKRQKIRSSLQSKGTKGCKKVLKRLSGKEKRTSSIVNHTIAKRIVAKALRQGKGIALENLKGIRKSANKKGRKFRSRVSKWNFADLRTKIEYKAKMAGIPVVLVDPAYTSQTCSQCHKIGSRNGESFKCPHCGFEAHADMNAARNISGRAVNHAEKSVKGHLAPNQV
jgi:IS605 OrfB family transposase